MTKGIYSGALQGVALFNGTGQKVGSEAVTGAIATIDSTHLNIHNGIMFIASYKSPNASPIADDGVIDVLLVTSTLEAHLVFEIAAGGDSEFLLFEDVTTSDDGTALAEINQNRNSLNTSQTTATHTPTVSDTGTQLLTKFQPGGSGGVSMGSSSFIPREWILKPSLKYLIRGINRAGTAQPMSIVAQWYDH